jgi:hypothetical protein
MKNDRWFGQKFVETAWRFEVLEETYKKERK